MKPPPSKLTRWVGITLVIAGTFLMTRGHLWAVVFVGSGANFIVHP